MGAAEIEIAFGRLKEIYDEETSWQLFYLKHMNDADNNKRKIMQSRIESLEMEKESIIRSISMGS